MCDECENFAWSAGKKAGAASERERIVTLLTDKQVIRRDALGFLVFANCDTLKIEYLTELEGETK